MGRQHHIETLKKMVLDYMEEHRLDYVRLDIQHHEDYCCDEDGEEYPIRTHTDTFVMVDHQHTGVDPLQRRIDSLNGQLNQQRSKAEQAERDRDSKVVQQLTVDVINRWFKPKPVGVGAETQPDV